MKEYDSYDEPSVYNCRLRIEEDGKWLCKLDNKPCSFDKAKIELAREKYNGKKN